jgi:fibronectin type III domain protein
MSLSWGTPLLFSAAAVLTLGCGDPTASSPPLAEPTNLTLQELASGDLELSWQDNSDNEATFQLNRSSSGPSGTYSLLGEVDAGVSTYQDSTVDGLSEYCYRVRAVGPSGTAPSPFSAATCYQSTPPSAPTGLQATANFGQVDLSWNDASDNEESFEIWESAGGVGGTFTRKASVATGVSSYSRTGLQNGAEYCYEVRAVGSKGQPSAFSTTACATTPVPSVPPPAAPTALAASASSPTAISLVWTDNASNEEGFEVWRSTSGPSGAYVLLSTTGANTTSSGDAGLTPLTEYCYEVRAVGGAGVPPSGYSNSSCATTAAAPPAAPSNLSAAASTPTEIELAWTDNASDEEAFEVWRSTSGPGGSFTLRTTVGADLTSSDDNGLTPGAEYCYKVRAIGGAGVPPSGFSGSSCATPPLSAPATPTSLLATARTASRIDLAWQDNATDEAQYEVWRSTTGPSGSYTLRTTRPASSESYSDTGLSASTQYCYKVRAKGANGAPNSPFTGPSCDTTRAPTVVRVVTFGDSNTDRCSEDPAISGAYVSIVPRLAPNDDNLSCQLAGKIEAQWESARTETIHVVNHGISSSTTGGLGGAGDPVRTGQGSPNARTTVNGTTRFDAEVLGLGFPWSGGEPTNSWFPSGPISRAKAFTPGANDFAYVSMGTNDDAGPTRTMTAAETEANLRWMVGRWIAVGRAPDHFVLTTLAPRDDANSPASIPDRNVRIRALAAELGVHLIDLANHVSDDNGATWRSASLNIGDGIHYTETVRGWIAGQVVAWMSSITP